MVATSTARTASAKWPLRSSLKTLLLRLDTRRCLPMPDIGNFVSMHETVRNRINNLIGARMSLEQVIEAKPTAEFAEKYESWGGAERSVDRVYLSLAR